MIQIKNKDIENLIDLWEENKINRKRLIDWNLEEYTGEIEQAYNGQWYIKGYAPEKPQSEINQERINELQAYLTSTDWYAVRYAETGVAIPEDVVTARSSAREEISTLRVDVEELI